MNKTSKSAGASAKTPSQPPKSGTDLSAIFNMATLALVSNQSSLNQVDTENQNHGDNMVQAFNMISQALASKKGSTPSDQLRHASQALAQNGTSGSAQVYSEGLAQAAQKFEGQSAVTPDNAMMLVQSLLGGGQQATPHEGGDLMEALLGSGESAPQGGNLVGALLGGQTAPQGVQQGDGLDLGDLLNAGMTFMNAKQQGQDNMQAALSALIAAGPLGQKPHRQQSGQVVGNAILKAITNMASRNQR